MVETESSEKVINGPPPKLDLRKEGLLKSAQPAPPQATTVAPVAAAPGAPRPAATAARPQGPFIKLGFTGEADAKRPGPTTIAAVGRGPGAPVLKRPTMSSPLRPGAVVAPSPVQPAAAAALAASKSETAKVPLEMAMPTPAPVAPKMPAAAPAAVSAPPAGGVVDEKKLTSRISLEAVLMPEGEDAAQSAASEFGPKTIRLKRPSEAATVKVVPRPKLSQSADDGTGAASALSRTARLEEPTEEEAGGGETPTRRKTIKIKRPTETPSMTMRSARGPSSMEAMQFVVEDEPMWIFPTATIAATLVVCVLIYVFLSQAFGPDLSLTELSYGAPDMNLPWPGKIMIMQ